MKMATAVLVVDSIAFNSWVWFPAGAGPFYVEFACTPNVHPGPSPVNTLDQGIGLEHGECQRAPCCGCPLLLSERLNAENKISLYIVYM